MAKKTKKKTSAGKTKNKATSKNREAKDDYRPPTYPAARRFAHLVSEFPIGERGLPIEKVLMDYSSDHVKPLSEQTLRRDIKALNEEFQTADGEPVFIIEKRGETRYLVRRPGRLEGEGGNIYQLVSMYLSLEYLRILDDEIISQPIEDAMERIEALLPASKRGLLREFPRKFFAAPSPHKDYSSEGCKDALDDVIASIVYQNEMSICYKKLGQEEPWWMRVQPLTLLYHRGSLYLIAIKVGYEDPVYFNIERIKESERHRDARFEYPDNYNPRQMLDGAFGVFGQADKVKTFRIKFPPELKEYIMYWKVHETQQFEEQEDGSVILTMEVTDSEEVRSWIRSFGEGVKST